MDNYEDKLNREKEWHTNPVFRAKHFLNSRLFYSPERNAFNYIFPRKRLALTIGKIIKANGLNKPSMLIAPIGTGVDIQYIRHLSQSMTGIDISQEAMNKITDHSIEKYTGDMRNMIMFPDNRFDIVVVPLFFHHFVRYGFDPFLAEAYRVLKPNGLFFSLEPSFFHPVSWITWGAKKLFGNITGQVEDEIAFNPLRLTDAMKRCGFHDVQVFGASFSHNRVPIWISYVNNVVTFPLLKLPFIKYFAWMCVFHGRKQKSRISN